MENENNLNQFKLMVNTLFFKLVPDVWYQITVVLN